MKFIDKIINTSFGGIAVFGVMLALCVPAAWAAGNSDQIETVTAEGGEIWDNDFDVTERKKGLYNFIVYARDRAGNEAISGPYNINVDPHAGLPAARVVYPENHAIIRQSINVLGVASGHYGVDRVLVRLDNEEYVDVTGTEYWNRFFDLSSVPDGRHMLHVHAIDSKGAQGPEVNISFILDTSPPAIELTSHKIGDIITGTDILRGKVIDTNGVKAVEFSEDGVTFKHLPVKIRGHHTELDFFLPINTKKIPDGPVVYYLRAQDNTGVVSVKPYLFFVTNSGPDLEIYTPAPGENIIGTFYLSGYAYDTIGLSKVYYEWGRHKEEIEMRPGDPFWNVTLEAGHHTANTIKVSAADKVGNVNSITLKLEDRRKVKVPVLVIDYPFEEDLKAMQKHMPPDTAIYGHIAPGADPHSVLVHGSEEVDALTSFRIDPYMMIHHGKKAQTLQITPVDIHAVKGATTTLRYMKPMPMTKDESAVTVTSPEKNSWRTGASFTLEGSVVINAESIELEYRLNPQDSWIPLRMDTSGRFRAEIPLDRPQGPVHMELRTIRGGADDYPIYHPFNWAVAHPEVQFVSPAGEHSLIYGNKTVMGVIDHSVPVFNVAYSLDRNTFTDIPFVSRYGKAWFSYFCDFNALGKTPGGRLVFRVTDSSGAAYYETPEYTIEPNPPLPVLIVNTPGDDEVITDPFEISGLAYDDVGIKAVYYRVLGPKMASLSPGAAGDEARRYAAYFEANPNRPFVELLTDQNFEIPIDFSMIIDGEYTIEIYAADLYGVRSETISRVIKVSTLPPETEILSPPITRYNRKAIVVRGFSSDANVVDSVALSMDNGNTFQNVILHTDGSWELPLNTAAYTDAVYSALVRTRDKYGVTSFSNVMLNIDNTPPEMFLTSPMDGQHVGNTMHLMGRVSDNLALKSLSFQIISSENPNQQFTAELEPKQIIFDPVSLGHFRPGEYMIRLVSKDLADNESVISRKIIFDPDDKAAQIAIYNPLPGEIHCGPVNIVGIVTGAFKPSEIHLMLNNQPLSDVTVDRYGIFRYEIPAELLTEEAAYGISAYYNTDTGTRIDSPNHTVYYANYGPILQVESHGDGDVISGRPWLSGRAWFTIPEPAEDDPPLTRQELRAQQAELMVKHIMVSHDNGRTFKAAKGTDEWKFRLETSELPRGPQPVLVKAEFANGEEAVRRMMVYVDTTIPQVETLSPMEDSRHRDDVRVFGTAGDNYELAEVDVSLRPYDKFFYSVPGAIQGLYFDVKGLGATFFDVGLGLSFFDDNVRFQGQFGITPDDPKNGGVYIKNFIDGGRYVGYVYGIKLLANIFYLPFDYFFGLDWAFYSMNFAVGANFSYFMMDEWRTGLYMGALIGQWDIANVNFQYFKPNWKYFRNYALYLQPELWFASTDVNETVMNGETVKVNKTIFRMTVGMRINWF